MKKFLRLTLVALCAMVSSVALAETEKITLTDKGFTNGQSVTTVEGENITLTFDQGTGSNPPAYYNTGTAVRIYGNNTLTISATEGTITNIQFTFSGSNKPDPSKNDYSFDSGEYDAENDAWTGSATSVTLQRIASSGHFRLQAVEVTYTTSSTVIALPAISGETTFEGSTEVTITGVEGSTIYYTTDGTDPTTSSTSGDSPVKFTLENSATVKAIAVVGGNQSEVASKEFTKVEFTDMTVADIQELTNDQEYVNLTIENGKVVYIDSRYDTPNVFIRDGENAIMFYSTNLPFTANATVKGTVKVNYVNFRGIHEAEDNSFTDATNLTITDSEEEAQPVTTTIADVLALKHKCDLIKIMNVTITKKDGKYYASDGENEIQLYGNDDVVKDYDDDGKSYNVTAVFNSIYSNKAQLLPVAVEVSSGIENVTVEPEFDENAPVYNLAGQRVGKDAKGIVIQNGKKFIRK